MKNKIGIIGLGIVGSAIEQGFEKLGHDILAHDIKLKTDIKDLLETEACFICVPTKEKKDGRCDTEIVEDTVKKLSKLKYKGIVVIKSTVEPGTTDRLQKKYKNLKICFVPEFLRERCAVADFIEKHDLCIIGTEDKEVFKKISEIHGKYPKEFYKMPPKEAELAKYFNNLYHSTLITFANSFYDVCKELNANYSLIKDAMVKQEHITDRYLDCNENFRAFGGSCLPKDLRAIINLGNSKKIDTDFFKMIKKQNDKYKISVFKGMRK